MSRMDQITKKRAMSGNTRSFSMNHSKRSFGLNLQTVKIKEGNQTKSIRVSARTMKTLKKQNKIVK
ncbi:MAG: 50S ribosomal protein L28 [Mycoplasmataceae bacterium]|jgi:large subunit ribosomal protein L28|nr:50S ribosomal protein L28 [Mycoplasmataceae bacterium]